MAPITETDEKAEEWFNEYVPKLRFKQDYDIYPGESEPLIEDGENVGIKIKRPCVSLFNTGVTKLYQMVVLGEKFDDVEYTKEEEAEFDREWNEKYGEDKS